MPPKVVPPSVKLKAFNCPRCGALADQSWYKVYAQRSDDTHFIADESVVSDFRRTQPDPESLNKHQEVIDFLEKVKTGEVLMLEKHDVWKVWALENVSVSSCRSCAQLTLWKYDTIVYPPVQYEVEPNDDLTDEIKADFNEARRILDLSPRGAAALLRLCIQKLCAQLGQSGKNINDDIAALVKGGLDPRVQKALDIVRVVGNECVHPGTMDMKDDRDTASKLFELVNRIAFDMITHQKELDLLYAGLPADKIAAIAKRDGNAATP